MLFHSIAGTETEVPVCSLWSVWICIKSKAEVKFRSVSLMSELIISSLVSVLFVSFRKYRLGTL